MTFSNKAFQGPILFCTNFTEGADYSYAFALEHAQMTGATDIHILFVMPEADAQFWRTYLYEIENVDDKAQMDIYHKITDTYIEATPRNIKVNVLLRQGKPEEQILNAVKKLDAGLVVIGRERAGKMTNPLFGSVVEKIGRKAKCPVLIVPQSFAERRQNK